MALPRTTTIAIAGSQHTLEGRLQRVEGSSELAVVAPPHPLHGGTIGNPAVRVLERALNRAGLSTLAFNFRGTGESSGSPSEDPSEAHSDYRAALASVPDLRPTWLTGYSFGSVAALTTAIELSIPHVLMLAPPLGLLDPVLPPKYRGQLAIAVGDDDEYAPTDAVRERFAQCPNVLLELIEGVDHFFLGSQLEPLSAALDRLLTAARAVQS